jgi:hypothetical protein
LRTFGPIVLPRLNPAIHCRYEDSPQGAGYSTRLRIKQVSESLKESYEGLAGQLPKAEHLHADETGWKENGELEWVWVFRTALVTVFKIALSRGSGVLETALGKGYEGIVSCDFWGAYRKYAGKIAPLVLIQFCRAHLIREILEHLGNLHTARKTGY